MKHILSLLIGCHAVTAFAQVKINWHDVTQWGIEGRGWGNQERKRWFDRFPAKAEDKVTASVWGLSRHSAGMMVRFKTDANAILAKWKVTSSRLGMPHMPPSGVSGLDLYARRQRQMALGSGDEADQTGDAGHTAARHYAGPA